ncbi:MAG TPA: SurA N-terminal domain-containing protein [Thermoanaerobaculia bacterium]|nr:SurA N-terminal domain-containing protein [Thermoanaerobaculia bacterium]
MTSLQRRSTCSLIARSALLASLGLAAAFPVAAEVANRVVLRVNDRIVTLYDFDRQLARARADILEQARDSEQQRTLLDNAPREVMRSLFDELLILTRADQLGLAVRDLEVDQEIREQMTRFGLSTEEEMRAALAQNGITLEQFRTNLRNQLLWREVTQEELYPRIAVDEQELRALYRERASEFAVPEQRRLREVVVLEDGGLDADGRARVAGELRAAWVAGGDPEELVAGARADHGELAVALLDVGWVGPGDLAPELERAVWQLAPGDVSEPIAARGGLHLAQVLELKEQSQRPFEDVRNALLARERSRRFEQELEKYLEELEEKAYYDFRPPQGLEDFETASGRRVREGQRELLAPGRQVAEPVAPPR